MKRAAIAVAIALVVFGVGALLQLFTPGITAIVAMGAAGLYIAVSRRSQQPPP